MYSFWTDPKTKDAYNLSVASIVIELVAIIIGLVVFKSTGSSLSLVYGLENIVDCISSIVVLWRFFAPSTVDEAIEQKLQAREQRASLAISWILFFLGGFILVSSLSELAQGEKNFGDETYGQVLVLSFFSTIVFGFLCVLKFRYARILQSDSLYKDGLCSLIGTILSAAMFINTLLVRATPNAWWIDPLIALFAGIGATYIGLSSLYRAAFIDFIPICSCWCCFGGNDIETTTSTMPSSSSAAPNVEMRTAPGIPDEDDQELV